MLRENQTENTQEAFIRNHHKRHRLIHYTRFFLLILFLFLWEFGSCIGIIDSFFFSSPSGIIQCIKTQWSENHLLGHISITFLETLTGFLLVTLISLLTAILLWRFDFLSKVLEPFLVILNSLPKSALAPLFIVWFGTNTTTIIIAGISVAVFCSIINIYAGFKQTDSDKILLIKTLGGTEKDTFFQVVLPSSLPLLLNIAKVNIGLSLVGVIIGEFLAARRGLGYLIIYGTQIFKLDLVISSIIILCAMAYGLYAMLQYFEHKMKKSKFYE